MAEQKKITPFVADHMPDFVRGDHPTFVAFVEAYYEWLEDPNNSYSSVLVLQDLHDIDETLDVFADKFYNEFLKNFPVSLAVNQTTGLPVDKRKLMKNINDFYRAKGTENSYKLLFRILFDTNVEFYYPKSDILRESDGQWIENKSIKITTLNGDGVFDCEGKEIKQISSTGAVEATALVDKLVRYTVGGYEVAELFLVNIFGLFEANKTIECAISSTKTITETIYPILSSITIDTPGLGYKIGDDITVVTTNIANGVGAKATVGRVDQDGKIVSIIVTDSGVNYIDVSDITLTFASDTTTEFATGTPVSSGLTRYNGFFENNDGLLSTNKVIQDSHFYQEYSYQLKTESTLNSYKDTLKKLIHPAGMELFGQILIKKNLQDTHPFFSTVATYENSLVGNYTPYTNDTYENLRLNSQNVDLYPEGYNGYGNFWVFGLPPFLGIDNNNIRLWVGADDISRDDLKSNVPRNIFDKGVSGTASIARGITTTDPYGATVNSGDLRYGPTRTGCMLNKWTEEQSISVGTFPWVQSGYDRDGESEVMVTFNSSLEQIWVYEEANGNTIGTAPADLANNWTITVPNHSGHGTNLTDIRQIDVVENGGATPSDGWRYAPYGAVVLPGCILFATTREEYQGVDGWIQNGIALFSIQHDTSQSNWAFSKIGETNIAGATFAMSGATTNNPSRGRSWAVSNYFPAVNQDPLVKAYIPITDYQHKSGGSADGGELYLTRAARGGMSAAWSFGWYTAGASAFWRCHGETTGYTNQRHYHSAAWTPRGMVLSIGDTIPENSNILITSDDWDDFPTANNVTHLNWDGSVLLGSDIGQPANQWASCCSGKDINTILCSSDEQAESVYELTVPADWTDGPDYKVKYGIGPELGFVSPNQVKLTCLEVARPAPEKSKRVVSRYSQVGFLPEKEYSRVLYSPDAENFCVVGRKVDSHSREASHTIFNNRIIELAAGSENYLPRGVMSMPIPPVYTGRPIQVSPGGTNQLFVSDTGEFLSVGIHDGGFDPATVTYLAGETGPGLGPVYNIQTASGPSASNRFPAWFRPRGTGDPWDTTDVDVIRVQGSIRINEAPGACHQGVDFGLRMNGVGSSVNKLNHFHTSARNEWRPFSLLYDATGNDWTGSWTPFVDFFISGNGNTGYYCNFDVQMEGIYFDGGHSPYPIAPGVTSIQGTTGPNEQVTIALSGVTHDTSIAMSFMVPENGKDSYNSYPVSGNNYTLACLYGDSQNYTNIVMNMDDGASPSIDFVATKDGAVFSTTRLFGESAQAPVALNRLDQIDIAVGYRGATVSYSAIVGGRYSNMTHMVGFDDSLEYIPSVHPTEIRIGDNNFSTVPNIEVLRTSVDTSRQLEAVADNTMLEDMNTILWSATGGNTDAGAHIMSLRNIATGTTANSLIPCLEFDEKEFGEPPTYHPEGTGINHGATHGLKRNNVAAFLKKPAIRCGPYNVGSPYPTVNYVRSNADIFVDSLTVSPVAKNAPEHSIIVKVMARKDTGVNLELTQVTWGGTALTLVGRSANIPESSSQQWAWIYKLQGGVTHGDPSVGSFDVVVGITGGTVGGDWGVGVGSVWDMYVSASSVAYADTEDCIDEIMFFHIGGASNPAFNYTPKISNRLTIGTFGHRLKGPSGIGFSGPDGYVVAKTYWDDTTGATVVADAGFLSGATTFAGSDTYVTFGDQQDEYENEVTYQAFGLPGGTAINGTLVSLVTLRLDRSYVPSTFNPVDIVDTTGDYTGPTYVFGAWNKPSDVAGKSFQRVWACGYKYLSDFKSGTSVSGEPLIQGPYSVAHFPHGNSNTIEAIKGGYTAAGSLNAFGRDRTHETMITESSSPTGNKDRRNFRLFGSNSRKDFGYAGDLTELIVITEELSSVQRENMLLYLKHKYSQPNVPESGATAHVPLVNNFSGGAMPHGGSWAGGASPPGGSAYYKIFQHPRVRGVADIPANIPVIDVVFAATGGYTINEDFIIHEEVIQYNAGDGGFTAKGKVIDWQNPGATGIAGATLTIEVSKNWTGNISDFTAGSGAGHIVGACAAYNPSGGTITIEYLANRRFADVKLNPFFRLGT